MTIETEAKSIVVVDMKKCVGSGMCTTIAPRVFALDENGALVINRSEVTGEEANAVRDAAACCPVDAISIRNLTE